MKVTFIPFIQSQLEIFDPEGGFSSLPSFAMQGSDSLGQPSSHTVAHEASVEEETAGTARGLNSHSTNGKLPDAETALSDPWLGRLLCEALGGAFSRRPIVGDKFVRGHERRIVRGSNGWNSFLILLLKHHQSVMERLTKRRLP
jgi:hypothetical protein